jgi:hypothetical protein
MNSSRKSSKVRPIPDYSNSNIRKSSKSSKNDIIKDEEFDNIQVNGNSVKITYKPPKKGIKSLIVTNYNDNHNRKRKTRYSFR